MKQSDEREGERKRGRCDDETKKMRRKRAEREGERERAGMRSRRCGSHGVIRLRLTEALLFERKRVQSPHSISFSNVKQI